jgi:hypothetical protein
MSDSSGGMSMKGGGRVKDKPKKTKTKTKVKTKDDGPKLSPTEQFYGTSGKVEQPMADYYDRYTTEAVDPISMLPPDYFNRLGGYLFRRNPDEEEVQPVRNRRPPVVDRRFDEFPNLRGLPPQVALNMAGAFSGPTSMGSETIEFDPSMLEGGTQEDIGISPNQQFGMSGRRAIFDRNRQSLSEEPAPTGNLTLKRKKVVTPPVFADSGYDDFQQFDPMRFAPRGGIF